MTEEFAPDTIVRVKATGRFARIKKRCFCGSPSMPLHYEGWIEGDEGQERPMVLDHDMLEFEWPPKEVFENLVPVYC